MTSKFVSQTSRPVQYLSYLIFFLDPLCVCGVYCTWFKFHCRELHWFPFLFLFSCGFFHCNQYLNPSQIWMLTLPAPKVQYSSGDNLLLCKGCNAKGDLTISECLVFEIPMIWFFEILTIWNTTLLTFCCNCKYSIILWLKTQVQSSTKREYS